MGLGENIRGARKVRGLTQKQLADRLGIACQNVNRWESGERDPKCSTLVKIAHTLGCSISSLVGEDVRDKIVIMTQSDVKMGILGYCYADNWFELALSSGEKIRVKEGEIAKITFPTDDEREENRKRWAELAESVKK